MESIDIKKLGKRIRSLRKEGKKKIKQKDFASRFGISASKLSKYESGKLEPSLNFLLALIWGREVSFHWLMTGKESSNPEEGCWIIREPKGLYGESLDNAKKLIDNTIKIIESGNLTVIDALERNVDVSLLATKVEEVENKGDD
jgi:transcriptional regulator with XRE-family HTH domain